MLLEQQPARTIAPKMPVGRKRRAEAAENFSRRALILAHTDVFSNTEVSAARQAVAWIALAICLAVLVLLAFGVS